MKAVLLVGVIGAGGALIGFFARPHLIPPVPSSADTARSILTATAWNDYLWPTDASRERTSCFAEFRSNHFHAGIDISTNMRTGYNVFATRDGWVHAISFEPGGYGWILTLRHRDGFYSCYAHLKGFPKALRDAYWKRLSESGHSFGLAEWKQDELPVKKGDVVAYTGDTGAGPPHLHFEIRDGDFNPVNPGLSKNLRPVDSIPPEPREICFMPLDARSSVNGQHRAVVLRIVPGAHGAWTVAGEAVLRGRVGVLLRAHDRANTAQDYPTPYEMTMSVDGSRFFDSRTDRIPDAMGWHIRIDRDHDLMREKRGEFRKLYREDGNLLGIYTPDTAGAGELSATTVGPGRKALRIVAKDVSGNAATVDAVVRIVPAIGLEAALRDGTIEVRADRPQWIEKVVALEGTGAKRSAELASVPRSSVASRMSMRIPSSARIVTVEAREKDGTVLESVQLSSAQGDGALQAKMTHAFERGEIVCSITTSVPLSGTPDVRIQSGDRSVTASVRQEAPTRWTAVASGWDGLRGMVSIETHVVAGAKTATARDSFDAAYISVGHGGEACSQDSVCTVRFAPHDVVDPMFCTVTRQPEADATQYLVSPLDVPLAGTPTVAFRAHGALNHEWIRGNSTFVSQRLRDLSRDVHAKTVSAVFARLLGSFELLEDVEPPVITLSASGRGIAGMRIRITDAGSGVNLHTLVVERGGRIVPVEYSEGLKSFVVPPGAVAGAPASKVTVRVSDNAGNIAEKRLP